MGDLPGQVKHLGANKGQLEHFDIYHETLIEWVRIANEYKIPTFVIGCWTRWINFIKCT